MSLDCAQSHRQGAMGSDSIAHPVGRKDWACAAFPQHSTSTGCPTKRAQSILWGNAAEHLSSNDVHSQNWELPNPTRARPAGMAGMTVRYWSPALAAHSTPRRLGLPSQAAALADCPCVAMLWMGFLTPAALPWDYTDLVTHNSGFHCTTSPSDEGKQFKHLL